MPRKNPIPRTSTQDVPAHTPIDNVNSPQPADDQAQPQDPAELIPLSPDEERFVNFLFQENMNRTRAYMRAYPKSSPDSARASASRMLAKVNIQADVRRRLDEEAMSTEEGIYRLSQIARGTMLPFLKEGPDGFVYMNLNDPEAEEYMFLVKEMEAKRQRRIVGQGEAAEEWEDEWVKVKLYSSYEATVDLLKIQGKFTKKVDLTSGGKPLPAVDHEGFERSMKTFAEAIVSELQRDDSPKTPES